MNTPLKQNSSNVIVIGAGVAGASAAYELAQNGIDVMVIEKETLPRYKTCGGGVVHRAINNLPFSTIEIVERDFRTIDIFDHASNLFFNVKREKVIVTMTMRADLDNLLIKQAVKKGAKLKDGIKVKQIINNTDNVDVVTENVTLKASFVIAADGASGVSSKISRLNKYTLQVPAIECEIYLKENIFNNYKNSARFDYGFIPHGYAWVFPKKNHLSVGIALFRKHNINLNNYLQKYIAMLEFNSIDKVEKHGHHIPINPVNIKPVYNRILLTGDAIGLADPITTEGISYAIESGQLAAKAIIEGDKDKKRVTKIYNKSLKPLFNELKYARILAWFVHGSPFIRRFIFKHYGKPLSELLADVIMGDIKYSRLMKNPVNYFKLLRPGYFIRKKE